MTTSPEGTAPDQRDADTDGLGYAEAITELERILDELADDDVDVDVLSIKVARASALIRLCRGRIRAAELQVTEIVAELDGGDDLAPDPLADPGDR